MTKNFRMLAKEVAPGRVETVFNGGCGGGACPAVLEAQDGGFIVIGNRLSSDELCDLEGSGMVKVYDHEFAVRVSPELIKKAMRLS